MNTFTLQARNGGPALVEVVIPNLIESQIKGAFDFANTAFRSVEISSNDTGEIIFSAYTDNDYYKPCNSLGYVINALMEYYGESKAIQGKGVMI